MKKRFCLLALVAMLVLVGSAFAQEMIVDMIANKVIQKYQQSTCEQLWQQKSQPKSPRTGDCSEAACQSGDTY